MVLHVARSVLRDEHMAQDVFQATFLILVKKARGLWVRDSLGPWLYEVAYRTALGARSAAARRRRIEYAATEETARASSDPDAGLDPDSERLLHEETVRLPERYRVPIVLCDMEGLTHERAARHLGWPIGTVKSRQARGRERLRSRLERRGIESPASVVAIGLGSGTRAGLPATLAEATVQAAVCLLSGRAMVGVVSAFATMLMRKGLMTMLISRFSSFAVMAFVAGLMATGVVVLAQQDGKPEPAKEGQVAAPVPHPNTATPAPTAKLPEEENTFEVQPGKLIGNVVPRGSLEPVEQGNVSWSVNDATTITRIVPEWTRVKKGDVVCELEHSDLSDQATQQGLVVQRTQADLELTRRGREVAEIALMRYQEGTFPLEQQALEGEIKLAEHTVIRARDQLERADGALQEFNAALSKQARAKTPVEAATERDPTERQEDARFALMKAEFALRQAKGKLDVLQRNTFNEQIKTLQMAVEKAKSDEEATKAALALEKLKLEKDQKQVDLTNLHAPCDGYVDYPDKPRHGFDPVIGEGTRVTKGEVILSVIDPAKGMKVNAKVSESNVDRVMPGLQTRIKVDAFPDQVFTGTVESVAPRPDPASWKNQKIKVYTTMIRINDGSPELHPGMTAQADILIKELNDVMSVPVSAILTYQRNKVRVAVRKADGGIELRNVTLGSVTLGTSKNEMVEVKQGLQPGERVVVDPKSLLGGPEVRKPPSDQTGIILEPVTPAK